MTTPTSTGRPLAATLGALVLGLVGAALAGAGFAGAYLTATVDRAAFGAFASFVVLATPYAYATAAALAVVGLIVMTTAARLYAQRWYVAGMLLSLVLAAGGVALYVFAERIPFGPAVLIAQGVGPLLTLPVLMLLLALPWYRRRR